MGHSIDSLPYLGRGLSRGRHIVRVTYQPASRYWPLQWYELGLFLAAAPLLAAASAWRVRKIG